MKKFILPKLKDTTSNLVDFLVDEVYPVCESPVEKHGEIATKNIDLICQYLTKCIGFNVICDSQRETTLYTTKVMLHALVNDTVAAKYPAYILDKALYHPTAIVDVLEPAIQNCHVGMEVAFDAVPPLISYQSATNPADRMGNYVKLTEMITTQLKTVLELVNIIEGRSYALCSITKFKDGKISFLVEDVFTLDDVEIEVDDNILHDKEAYKKFIADLCMYSYELKKYYKRKKHVRKVNKAALLISVEYPSDVWTSNIPVTAPPEKPQKQTLYTVRKPFSGVKE